MEDARIEESAEEAPSRQFAHNGKRRLRIVAIVSFRYLVQMLRRYSHTPTEYQEVEKWRTVEGRNRSTQGAVLVPEEPQAQ